MNTYNLIKKIDNNYSVVEVIDQNHDTVRILKSPNSNQSVSYIDERKFALYDSYSQLYDISAIFKNNVSDVLMLGGGGFSYPKFYIRQYFNKKMDVVEISKTIIDIANEYFFLDELYLLYDKKHERLKIYNMDAMEFLNNCNKKYDSIIVDLFTDLIPIRKFFLLPVLLKMSKLLNKEGCLCINYIINDDNTSDFLELYSNLKNMYLNIYLLSTDIAFQNNRGNIFIVSSNQQISFDKYCNYNIIDFEKVKENI